MQRPVSGILLGYFATGWMAGVQFPTGHNFSPCYNVHIGSGANLVFSPLATRVLSPGIKQPECESNHSSPSCADVKNAYS
jgi:hypothetical protein